MTNNYGITNLESLILTERKYLTDFGIGTLCRVDNIMKINKKDMYNTTIQANIPIKKL